MYRLKKILDKKITHLQVMPTANLYFFIELYLDDIYAYSSEDLVFKWNTKKKSSWYEFLGETLVDASLTFYNLKGEKIFDLTEEEHSLTETDNKNLIVSVSNNSDLFAVFNFEKKSFIKRKIKSARPWFFVDDSSYICWHEDQKFSLFNFMEGKEVWVQDLSQHFTKEANDLNWIQPYKETILVLSDFGVFQFASKDGTLLWSTPGAVRTIEIVDNIGYACSGLSLTKINLDNGEVYEYGWKENMLPNFTYNGKEYWAAGHRVVYYDGLLWYVVEFSGDSFLIAIDPQSGEYKWIHYVQTYEGVRDIIFHKDKLFIEGNYGTLYIYEKIPDYDPATYVEPPIDFDAMTELAWGEKIAFDSLALSAKEKKDYGLVSKLSNCIIVAIGGERRYFVWNPIAKCLYRTDNLKTKKWRVKLEYVESERNIRLLPDGRDAFWFEIDNRAYYIDAKDANLMKDVDMCILDNRLNITESRYEETLYAKTEELEGGKTIQHLGYFGYDFEAYEEFNTILKTFSFDLLNLFAEEKKIVSSFKNSVSCYTDRLELLWEHTEASNKQLGISSFTQIIGVYNSLVWLHAEENLLLAYELETGNLKHLIKDIPKNKFSDTYFDSSRGMLKIAAGASYYEFDLKELILNELYKGDNLFFHDCNFNTDGEFFYFCAASEEAEEANCVGAFDTEKQAIIWLSQPAEQGVSYTKAPMGNKKNILVSDSNNTLWVYSRTKLGV